MVIYFLTFWVVINRGVVDVLVWDEFGAVWWEVGGCFLFKGFFEIFFSTRFLNFKFEFVPVAKRSQIKFKLPKGYRSEDQGTTGAERPDTELPTL